MTSNIRGSSICSPKSLHKKTNQEILGVLKAAFKTGASKVPRPRLVLPSLLRTICQACVNSQLSPTLPLPPRGREKKNVTKMNFSSCNDHSPKWIINNCYIFFPSLRVWVFLFLQTSFFKAQHVGPMLQYLIILSVEQGGIKYQFFSLWYDSTWDWCLVSRVIGKHATPNKIMEMNPTI